MHCTNFYICGNEKKKGFHKMIKCFVAFYHLCNMIFVAMISIVSATISIVSVSLKLD